MMFDVGSVIMVDAESIRITSCSLLDPHLRLPEGQTENRDGSDQVRGGRYYRDAISVASRGENEIWGWSKANGFTGSHQSMPIIMNGGKVVSVPKVPDSSWQRRSRTA
jgi:hypothetical protein